jgi:malonate decarboxylase gamma subunit
MTAIDGTAIKRRSARSSQSSMCRVRLTVGAKRPSVFIRRWPVPRTAYARARLAGHPVIALLVGKAMSGAFLAHGYQANRLIALRDPGVMVHAMGKASAARVTLRSVEELEALAASVPPMAYDIDSYASLGLLWETLSVEQIEQPTAEDLARVNECLKQAISDIFSTDLSNRLGAKNRAASSKVRELLRAQW